MADGITYLFPGGYQTLLLFILLVIIFFWFIGWY